MMSHWTLRGLAYLALALASFTVADGAEASVGDSSGGALSSFGRLSPAQTVQYAGSNCYYGDGWNGRGWYQCGDEWSDGFGWIGPFNTFGGSTVRRHHRHGFAVLHPRAPNPVYPSVTSRRLGVGVPSTRLRGGSPAFGNGPRVRQFDVGGVHPSPGFHAGATVTPGFARGGLSGGNFHQLHGAGVPHIGAPISAGFAGGGRFHGLGGATGVHIGGPVSPGFAGGGGFHGLGGATGVHIGGPVSPSFAGGGFHSFGGAGNFGAPHIGAPASPGFAGGGFHGFGGGGVFHGGGAAFGQGGIGHR